MRNESGFTLISVLVAMVLLSVGILSLTKSLGTVTALHTETATRSTALAVARAYMEEVRGRPTRTLAQEAPIRVDEAGDLQPAGRFTRTVDVASVSQYLRRVTVRVDYPGARKPIELVTLAYVSGFVGK